MIPTGTHPDWAPKRSWHSNKINGSHLYIFFSTNDLHLRSGCIFDLPNDYGRFCDSPRMLFNRPMNRVHILEYLTVKVNKLGACGEKHHFAIDTDSVASHTVIEINTLDNH